jgi:oligogalacturonide transporter
MLVALAVFFFTWERPRDQIESIVQTERPGGPAQNMKRLYSDLWATMKIRAFRLHLGMYLGGYISQDIFNAVFTYFVVFALGSTVVAASNFLGAMAFAQLIAVAAFIPMCLRFHPGPSYRIAVSLFGVSVLGFLLLHRAAPANTLAWLYVPVLVAGLGRGGLNYIPWNTYNYMADVDEIVTGRRREGAFAGVMTFIRKTMQALAVMSVGLILQAGGFVSGSTTQTQGAVTTIVIMLGVGTLALLAFGFVVSLRFHLNRHTHEVLMSEIERFKTRPGTEPSIENRLILEDLTGWRYEDLWGRSATTRHLHAMRPASDAGTA